MIRSDHPEIHKYFGNRKPEIMKYLMLRSFIVENGERLYLSPLMEDFIASGRNFEHSKGAVHSTKLEVLFQVEKYIKQYKEMCKRQNKKEVKDIFSDTAVQIPLSRTLTIEHLRWIRCGGGGNFSCKTQDRSK